MGSRLLFSSLKKKLISAPVLGRPDVNMPGVVETDAKHVSVKPQRS